MLALLVAVALMVPLVVVIGSVDAQQPPSLPETVWPPGTQVDPLDPSRYGYFWDSTTRAYTPVNDFVPVELDEVVEVHMRANDVVSFRVCPSLHEGITVDRVQCQDQSLHKPAGGTCGAAVEDPGAVLGHEHVVTLCSGMYALDSLTMISGAANAGVAPKWGAIASGYPGGAAPHGVVEVTGKKLGVAQAQYCMTSYPTPCRQRALIDIVVEPTGWVDARVVGVDDEYRLELNWLESVAVLRARAGSGTDWGNAPIVGTYCCLSNPDFWRFDLRLPVMLGSDKIQTGRDVVVFLDSADNKFDQMLCLPLYCEHIVPKNPTVSRWAIGEPDSIGVDVEAAGKSLHVKLWGNPTDKNGIQSATRTVTPVITYCLAHWQQHCDASTCARATYRNARNLTLQDWMNVVPPSAYVATSACPDLAEVSIEVVNTTPATFDPTESEFDPEEFEFDPENTPAIPLEGAPGWAYRPEPQRFAWDMVPANPAFWCFPGRFLDSAIDDLEGDAALWIDEPTTTAVSPERIARFQNYLEGKDAEGNDVLNWSRLDGTNTDDLIAKIIEREYQAILLNPDAFDDRDPTIGAVWVTAAKEVYDEFIDPASYPGNHLRHYLARTVSPEDPLPDAPNPPGTIEDFIGAYVDSGGQWYVDPTVGPDFDFLKLRNDKVFDKYDSLFSMEWDRESLWQGLIRSEYQNDQGAVKGDGNLIRPVDHRLLEDPAAQTRSCLAAGTTMTIVGAWGTYPGAENWGDYTHGLCGHGLEWSLIGPPIPSTGPFEWHRRDADCPADALVAGSASLPQVWLRDDPDDGRYNPRLGSAWERALEEATACRDAPQCDAWAPPVPGYYQVRVRIERLPDNPFDDPVDVDGESVACWTPSLGPMTIPFGDPAPGPECAYHHYLTDRTFNDVGRLGWGDYWGPAPVLLGPDFLPPAIEFDDLIWVTGLRVDATQ